MKTFSHIFAVAAAILGTAVTVKAQAPCSVSQAVIDSARTDAHEVLNSSSALVAELRREQKLSDTPAISAMVPVKERFICAKMAGAFDHMIAPGKSFAVLRIGQIYYARDPDQRRSTGVITDTTFKVLMRLGASLP